MAKISKSDYIVALIESIVKPIVEFILSMIIFANKKAPQVNEVPVVVVSEKCSASLSECCPERNISGVGVFSSKFTINFDLLNHMLFKTKPFIGKMLIKNLVIPNKVVDKVGVYSVENIKITSAILKDVVFSASGTQVLFQIKNFNVGMRCYKN